MKKLILTTSIILSLTACASFNATNEELQKNSETALNTDAKNIQISNVQDENNDGQVKYIATVKGKKHHCYVQAKFNELMMKSWSQAVCGQ